MSNDDLMNFASEPEPTPAVRVAPWKILVVDDEEEVHRVTALALADFTVHGRPLQLLDAYTGRESIDILRQQPDIAMVLMDVVMETEHAGLDAVQAIRNDLKNRFVRIVLRTGQPGQAPEREVVRRFDINDYKEKTELTTTKLYTLLHTGLGLHRELTAMEQNRIGLEEVIEASASMFEQRSLSHFQRGLLQQLAALLYARRDAVIVSAAATTAGIAASDNGNGLLVVAGTGEYEGMEGRRANEVLSANALEHVHRALQDRLPMIGEHHFAVHFATRAQVEHVVYLTSESRFEPSDVRLVKLFCRNVNIAFENLALHQEVRESQRQLILLLSSAIEERSPELRHHVARVSEYSVTLGRLIGLAEEELESLAIAAAMHDLGKIAVPDAILNKPGLLTPEERSLIETHVEAGRRMLEGQRGELLKSSQTVISQHHERWDGLGYPQGLKGNAIHLYGRVVGLADTFDALTSQRCYKEPWPLPRVTGYLREMRGLQFEPRLVDTFLDNIELFEAIRARYVGGALNN